jgi:predicted Zn-dependent protease
MMRSILVVAIVALATPAHAQFGGIGSAIKKAQQAQEAKKKFDDLTFSEQEERQIGEDVSLKLRQRFGVVQDHAVHKYVSLVGLSVAQQSERPKLNWTFVVLDTDGVNAFAAPGGFVHVTRGALGLITNEAELAGVLGHEIGHITRKHTINALRKGAAATLATEAAAERSAFISSVASSVYANIIENAWDRGDELDADRVSVQLTPKLGYAPTALGAFLARLAERNKDQPDRNGLFASHPETRERISKIAEAAKSIKTMATVEPRYRLSIKYKPIEMTAIAQVADGASGPTGSADSGKEQPKIEEPNKAAPKPGGLGLGTLTQTVAPEKPSSQVSASGGARGVGPDRLARGGSNPAAVKVSISASELEAFRKGIS